MGISCDDDKIWTGAAIHQDLERQTNKSFGEQYSTTTHPTKKMSFFPMKNFTLVTSVSCFLLSTVLGFTTLNIECLSLLLTTQQLS